MPSLLNKDQGITGQNCTSQLGGGAEVEHHGARIEAPKAVVHGEGCPSFHWEKGLGR